MQCFSLCQLHVKRAGDGIEDVFTMIPTMSPCCKCPRESQNAALPSALSKVLQKKRRVWKFPNSAP